MKNKILFFNAIILFSIFSGQLYGHGFGANTYVKALDEGWWAIEQVCRQACQGKKQYVASYHCKSHMCMGGRVKSAGESETNCYFRLGFDQQFNDDVLCTPTQEFYVPAQNEWVPAYKVKELGRKRPSFKIL